MQTVSAPTTLAEPPVLPAASIEKPARFYRHRLPVRVMHWINVVCLTILLGSGLNIFNAHPALYWGNDSVTVQPWLLLYGQDTARGPVGRTRIAGVGWLSRCRRRRAAGSALTRIPDETRQCGTRRRELVARECGEVLVREAARVAPDLHAISRLRAPFFIARVGHRRELVRRQNFGRENVLDLDGRRPRTIGTRPVADRRRHA